MIVLLYRIFNRALNRALKQKGDLRSYQSHAEEL